MKTEDLIAAVLKIFVNVGKDSGSLRAELDSACDACAFSASGRLGVRRVIEFITDSGTPRPTLLILLCLLTAHVGRARTAGTLSVSEAERLLDFLLHPFKKGKAFDPENPARFARWECDRAITLLIDLSCEWPASIEALRERFVQDLATALDPSGVFSLTYAAREKTAAIRAEVAAAPSPPPSTGSTLYQIVVEDSSLRFM